MPRLPTVLDYGQRPSLRSNRVDLPDESGVIIADSLVAAAGKFAQLAGEKKAKDDRLNYSLAKNDILQADIQAREALKDREDFKQFDEIYTNGFQTTADKVISDYDLSGSDRALLSAESDLIRERGRVFAGDLSRNKRIDWQRGKIEGNLEAALREIKEAPPELQNDLMQTQLENITAAIDQGIYGDAEGQKRLQTFVRDAAVGSLDSMPADQRVAALETSLANRAGNGPISAEDLAEGKGTGSIADYLHADVARKMLDDAQSEAEMEDIQGNAFAAVDAAWEAYPGTASVREREQFIADALKDNPKARKEALILDSQKTARENTADSLARGDRMDELLNAIDMEGLTYNELDPSKLKYLTEPERRQLERASQLKHEQDGFSDYTTWEAQERWDAMSDEEKVAADLNGRMPPDPGNPGGDNVLWRNVVTRDRMNIMSAQRRDAEKRVTAGTTRTEPGGLTDTQFLEQYLVQTPWFDRKPTAADPKEKKDQWARIALKWDAAIVAEGEAGGGRVTEARRREILGDLLKHEVFVREFGRDPSLPAAAISEEQRAEAYIPLDQKVDIRGREHTIYSANLRVPERFGGGDMNAYQWIVNTHMSLNKTTEPPAKQDIEEVWFYLVTDGFDAAVNRIRGIEGY